MQCDDIIGHVTCLQTAESPVSDDCWLAIHHGDGGMGVQVIQVANSALLWQGWCRILHGLSPGAVQLTHPTVNCSFLHVPNRLSEAAWVSRQRFALGVSGAGMPASGQLKMAATSVQQNLRAALQKSEKLDQRGPRSKINTL